MSIKSDVQGFDISGKSALITGCGGLGTNAAVQLAGAGIGHLMLVDFDTVEERNLNRQFFYTKDDIGKDKALLLAERLSAFAPEVAIDYSCGKFNDRLAAGFDIILICVDNISTRKQIGNFCRNNSVSCINGSINGFLGTAYMYIPGISPDLESAGCLNESNIKNMSPGTTAAIIGSLQAQLAIDYFLGNTHSAGKLYIYDNNEIRTLKIRRDLLD